MNIHLPFDEKWNQHNKQLQQLLGLADDPRFAVQIYTSISQALTEVCYSLSDLIPHKKTIAHFKNIGPDFDSVAVSLSKRELTIKNFSRDEISKPEYLTGLSKELLLLVTSFDDPIVAARHDFSFLDEQLKEKKYFHIRLSNFLHFSESMRLPSHYEVLILSLSRDRTLVIAGERAKIRPEIAPKLNVNWQRELPLASISLYESTRNLNSNQTENLKQLAASNRAKVLAFELDLPKGISTFFRDETRVFDRSVLLCDGVDGLSMITKLSQLTGVNSEQFETTSLCRWQDARLFEYLYKQNHSPEALRGLIIIDVNLLNEDFKKTLAKIYSELLTEQNESLDF